jgi:hypothetical protein
VELLSATGSCPIESGLLGALLDLECPHGNVATDRVIDCSCWSNKEEKPMPETQATDNPAPPLEPPATNGHSKPNPRLSAAVVEATCARLGTFELADLARELGAKPESMRPRLHALREAGRVRVIAEGAHGRKTLRWVDEPEAVPAEETAGGADPLQAAATSSTTARTTTTSSRPRTAISSRRSLPATRRTARPTRRCAVDGSARSAASGGIEM